MDPLALLNVMQAPQSPKAPGPMDPLLQQVLGVGVADDRAAAMQPRLRRAQMLSMAPVAEGMRVGGTYQAASPLEHIATAMSRIVGNRQMGGIEKELAGLADQKVAARGAYYNAGADPMLGAMSGDPAMTAAGQMQMTEQQRRAANALAGRKIDADLAQQEAEAARYAAQQAETARHNRASEDAARSDAYGYGQDPTGGGFIFNKKTGQAIPLSPQGSFPGAGSGLKPQQFEEDIQKLGKDVEPVSQMKADLATLDAVIAKGSVPGFGPVSGHMPDMLTSREGIETRQAAKRVAAAIIQARSGTAASDKEVERLLSANGIGPTATDDAIRMGVRTLREQAGDVVRRMESKYHPTVVDTYHQRGGTTADAFTGSTPTQPAAQRKTIGGKTYEKRPDGWYEVQ